MAFPRGNPKKGNFKKEEVESWKSRVESKRENAAVPHFGHLTSGGLPCQ